MTSQLKILDNVASSLCITQPEPSPKAVVRTNDGKTDSFEKQDEQGEKKKINPWFVVAGVTVVGLIGTHIGLGAALKRICPDKPLTILGRITKLFDFASKDKMTGLFNKQALKINLPRAYAKSVKKSESLGVAMLDMDNFKAINEVFDHDKGDEFLKRIAVNIKQTAEKYKSKGFRFGGEEFIVVMPGHNKESAKKIAEEIAESIKNDKEIQKNIPEFLQKTGEKMKFLEEQKKNIDEQIFRKIKRRRGEQISIKDGLDISKSIVNVIDKYIENYKPADTSILNEIKAKFTNTKQKDLPDILSVNTGFGKNGENKLGKELDKIYTQYEGMLNDLTKWTKHLDKHGKFTVSGGVVDAKGLKLKDNGMSLVSISDAALKSAKENGKNQIIIANEEMAK